MTSDDRTRLRNSWAAARDGQADFAKIFFKVLFRIDPETRLFFARTDMPEQRVKLVAAIDLMVNSIDQPTLLRGLLAEFGQRNAQSGVTTHHYDTAGLALLIALGQTSGDTWCPDTVAAWTKAYALVQQDLCAQTPPLAGSTAA